MFYRNAVIFVSSETDWPHKRPPLFDVACNLFGRANLFAQHYLHYYDKLLYHAVILISIISN